MTIKMGIWSQQTPLEEMPPIFLVLLKRGYCIPVVGCFLESFPVNFWKRLFFHLLG